MAVAYPSLHCILRTAAFGRQPAQRARGLAGRTGEGRSQHLGAPNGSAVHTNRRLIVVVGDHACALAVGMLGVMAVLHTSALVGLLCRPYTPCPRDSHAGCSAGTP